MFRVKNKLRFLTLLVILLPGILKAQITALVASSEMSRGINMGNTMEPPLESAWNNGPAQEDYFDMYKNAGFKTVRIPVRWDEHTSIVSPYTIDAAWLNRVEEVVDWALGRDFYVIINAHHDDWLKTDYSNQKNRMDSIWAQISQHFKDKPENLFFEMLNEPRTSDHEGLTQDELDGFNARTLGIIRKTNPTRIVIFAGKGWSSSDDLKNTLVPDPDDSYLMASYHSYDPWNFAGTGNGTWGSQADINQMAQQMIGVKIWGDQRNVPVLIGEFGALKKCDYNSRMRYYANYARLAVKYGLAFTVWDDGGDFEVLQREDLSWNELKDILIYASDTTATALIIAAVEDSLVRLTWESPGEHHIKTIVERKTQDTEFEFLKEIVADITTFTDSSAAWDINYYYRLLEVYANDSIPSYPASISLLSNKREPFGGQAIPIPGTFEAEDFDIGQEGVCYHDIDVQNITGAYRTDVGVDIEARSSGGFHISYVEPGEWLEYTINVAADGLYDITAYVASLKGGGSIQYQFGAVTTPLSIIPITSNWETLATTRVSTELEAGEQIMRLKIISKPAFNIDKIEISQGVSVRSQTIETSRLFPNPVRRTLYLKAASQIKSLWITDVCGRTIAKYTINAYETEYNMQGLHSGMYIFHLQFDKHTETIRILKSSE